MVNEKKPTININPGPLLQEASAAVAAKDYQKAITIFTTLSEAFPPPNVSVPLIARAKCYIQLNQYKECLADAIRVLAMDDFPLPDEQLPNCPTSRVAAVTLAAQGK